MGRRFLDKSKQIHPKNLLRGLIKPNPLPYPLSLGEGISVICSRLAPHPFPKPLTKQFTGLFCSAESKEREQASHVILKDGQKVFG